MVGYRFSPSEENHLVSTVTMSPSVISGPGIISFLLVLRSSRGLLVRSNACALFRWWLLQYVSLSRVLETGQGMACTHVSRPGPVVTDDVPVGPTNIFYIVFTLPNW